MNNAVPALTDKNETNWHMRLFEKSVLKQTKFKQINGLLGDVSGKRCLDLGSDNGVISVLLRNRGGEWSSADINEQAVDSISSLVGERVFLTDGTHFPLADCVLDVVVIVDMLEHLEDDKALVNEITRVLRPGGHVIVNVPNKKQFSLLKLFRNCIGQTDEAHGHVRSGYSDGDLHALFGSHYIVHSSTTYFRIFLGVFGYHDCCSIFYCKII